MPVRWPIRVAREFARRMQKNWRSLDDHHGAGTCHWFHGDTTYRAVPGDGVADWVRGRNGGGWAHYVGQEKCLPVTGWARWR